MTTLVENFLIRFINVTKKKEGMFANFKLKGIKGGVFLSASIAVDLASVNVDPADPLEEIIEACSKAAEKELKRSEFFVETLAAI